jgi:hypothetical protein
MLPEGGRNQRRLVDLLIKNKELSQTQTAIAVLCCVLATTRLLRACFAGLKTNGYLK